MAVGVFPHYQPNPRYWAALEERSDEQRARLDHHLRYTCLHDSDDLLPRKEAALATIEGIAEIHRVHDVMFLLSDTRRLADDEKRLVDGVVHLSLDYVEMIAGVVRNSTRIVPSS